MSGEPLLRPSDAMVNIRATVRAAQDGDVISAGVARRLTEIGKALFYADRTYPRLVAEAARAGVDADELERFSAWLPAGARDVKREDAIAALTLVRDGAISAPANRVPFEHTRFWEDARRELIA